MRSTRAAIGIGGFALSLFFLLLLVPIILAAGPPVIPQRFQGTVTVGTGSAQDGLEIRVKVSEGGTLLTVPFTQATINSKGNFTAGGRYGTQNQTGDAAFFEVASDDPDTSGTREGAKPLEPLLFFIVLPGGLEVQAALKNVETGVESASVPFESARALILNLSALGRPSPPTLLAPPDTSVTTDTTPEFVWTQVVEPDLQITGDLIYSLEIASGLVDFTSLVFTADAIPDNPVNSDGLQVIKFQLPAALVIGDYIWHVRARETTDNTGDFSVPFTFTIVPLTLDQAPPPPPVLLSPDTGDQIADSTPEFGWVQVIDPPFTGDQVVTGDLTYGLEIASGNQPPIGGSGEFVSPVRTAIVADQAVDSGGQPVIKFLFSPAQKLSPGFYSWHVRAVDAVGNRGDFSPFNSFEVVAAVDLSLDVEPEVVRADTTFTVTLRADPQGREVSLIDAFLDFTTGDVEVLSLSSVTTALEVVLTADFDNQAGTIDYSATTAGTAPTSEFPLAVITFRAKDLVTREVDTIISFNKTDPRKTDAIFLSESVLGNANPATVPILNPLVDIRLGLQQGDQPVRFTSFLTSGFTFVRDEEFRVFVRVEPNGQRLTNVDALLDFDPSTLKVLSVDATGDRVTLELLKRFDEGTIDFSAQVTSGDGTAFDLLVITLRARRTTRGLPLGFSQEHPRRTDAVLGTGDGVDVAGAASVLRDPIGFPVEIALGLRLNPPFQRPFDGDVVVRVRPNGNKFTAVDTFLDFDTGDQANSGISIDEIIPGERLEVPLVSTIDNTKGLVDFSRVTFGAPPVQEFILAVLDITAFRRTGDDRIDFHTDFLRKTLLALNGTAIPDTSLRLVGLSTNVAPPGPLPNLKKTTPDFITPPSFEWDPPIQRPAAGISTFVISITKGAATIRTGDVRQFGTLQCLGDGDSQVDCFALGTFDVANVRVVRLSLNDPLSDGDYGLAVTAIDNIGQPGEVTSLPEPFTIDTQAPAIPIPTGDLGVDGAFTNDISPLLEWLTSQDLLSDVEYDIEVDDTANFTSPLIFTTGDRPGVVGFEVPANALASNTRQFWHVRAVDDAGVEPAEQLAGEGQEGAPRTFRLSDRGNASDFSPPIGFIIDTVLPTVPGTPTSISSGGAITPDKTPTFQWLRSTDAGFVVGDPASTGSGVDLYNVVITGDDFRATTLSDSACDDTTRLCTFTVATDLADGNYTIEVSGVDIATNESQPSTADFLVDTTPPTIPGKPQLVGGSVQTGSQGQNFEVQWARSTNTGSGVDFYILVINPGRITITADDSDADCPASVCKTRTPDLPDGTYTVAASAVDNATNQSAQSPASDAIFLGNPEKPQNLLQTGDKFSANAEFQWTGPRAGDVGTYQVTITGDVTQTGFQDFKDPQYFSNVTCDASNDCTNIDTGDLIHLTVGGTALPNGLPDGNHIFGARVITKVGITGDVAEVAFQVDTTAPDAPTDLVVVATKLVGGKQVKDDTRTPTFTWTRSTGDATANDISGFDKYEITIIGDKTGKVVKGDILGVTNTEFTILTGDSLPDDGYTVALVAIDIAGNRSAAATADFVVDLDAPTTPADLVKTSPDSDRTPTFAWTAATDDGLGVDKNRILIQSEDLIDITAPLAPVLISPVDSFVKTGVLHTFVWNHVSDETGVTYFLEIATGGQPTTGAFVGNLVFSTADIPGEPVLRDGKLVIEFTLPITLAAGVYKWHVQASDGGRNVGPFSSPPQSFTALTDDIQPPVAVIVAPDGVSTTDATPTFIWTAVIDPPNTGAVTYNLEITLTTDIGFSNPVFTADSIVDGDPGTTGDIEFTLPDADALAQAIYLWRVRGVDLVGNTGGFSANGTVRVDDDESPSAPTALDPTGGSTADGATPMFKWTQVSDPPDTGDLTYVLEIATGDNPATGDSGEFISPVFVTGDIPDIVAETSGDTQIIKFTLPVGAALDPGLHTWHVRAVDDVGNTGDFSTADTFVTPVDSTAPDVPVLVASVTGDSTRDDTPTFDWNAVAQDPSGITYELQVSLTGDADNFTNVGQLVFSEVGLTETSFTPSDPLPHPETVVTQQIFWRVQARDGAGNTSGFSEIRDFTLDARAPRVPPGLVTDRIDPAITGDTYTPTFSWDSDPDVARYEVSLDGQPFRNIVTGDTTQITGDENVQFGGHHIFRVRAFDVIGNVSQAILFFIDAETSGDVATYTVADDDFLPLGLYNFDLRAQDLLVHQSLPATSDFFVTELVVALIDPVTGLSTFDVFESTSKSILLRIDPKGLSLDELDVSLKFDDTLLSITSIVTGDVTKVAGLELTDIVIGVNTADFLATFDPRNAQADLATINITTKSVTATTATSIEFVTTNTTEARLDGEPLPAILQDAVVTVKNRAAGGGGGGRPPSTNLEPIAIAIVDPLLLDEGGSVDFDGTGSLDPDGDIVLFDWDFGDGATAQGDLVSHVYADEGTFTVTLTVTDDGTTPATATDTATVTVRNVAPTIVRVSADPNTLPHSGGESTITVEATDPAGDNDPLLYSFDCDGIGRFEIGPQADNSAICVFTEDDEGTNTVNVEVDDQDGGVTSRSTTVTVSPPPENTPPIANAGGNQTVNEGATILVDGTDSTDEDGRIVTYEWDFGDGTAAEGPTQTHVYADDGTFTVTLTVTDDGTPTPLTDTDTMTVTVNNVAPTVDAGDGQRFQSNEGDVVRVSSTFTDLGSEDTHTATIDWGDASQNTTISPAVSPLSAEHVYRDDGEFTIAITVTDDDNGSGTATAVLVVRNVAPIVEAGDDLAAFVGNPVDFNGSFRDPGIDDTHDISWDFGDGASGVGLTPTHTYGAPGTFTATLTVTDDDGGSNRNTTRVVVLDEADLPLGFEASLLRLSDTSPNAGDPVTARVRITNTTDQTVVGDVELLVNGTVHHTFEGLRLTRRSSKTLVTPRDNPIIRTEAGVFAVQVGEELETFTIAAANIVVTNLRATPKTVGVGSDVEIRLVITNEGAVAGPYSVNISVDGDTDLRTGVLTPEQSVRVFRRVTIEAPLEGIDAVGPHSVQVNGQSDRYRVVPPLIDSGVPRTREFNRGTTTSKSSTGISLTVEEGPIRFGDGSITLTLPLSPPLGVDFFEVNNFVDISSGLSIIGTDVFVPLIDPVSGESEGLRIEGTLEAPLTGTDVSDGATGTFEELNLVSDEQTEDLSDDDPMVGKLGASFIAGLDRLPEGVSIEVTIKKELPDEGKTLVEQAARDLADPKIIANEAGTVTIETTNLPNDNVTDVEISIMVGFDWVLEFGRANIRIAHLAADGSVELLETECTGPNADLQFTCVGTTQSGFFEFNLLALATPREEFKATSLRIEPTVAEPGESIEISVDIANSGRLTDSFSSILKIQRPGSIEFEPVDVKRITLEGGETGTVSFFVTNSDPGHYRVEVEGLPGEFDVFSKIGSDDLGLADLKVLRRGQELAAGETVEPGDPLQFSVTVLNNGAIDGVADVEFRINGVLSELRALALPARGRLEDVRFDFTPPAEGTYVVELVGPQERASVGTEITAEIEPLPALFRSSDLEISPVEAIPGQEITIIFQLSNIGELPGSFTATLLLDGQEVATQDVTVDELSVVPVTFSLTAPDEAGDYTIEVEDLDGSLRVIDVGRVRVESITVPSLVDPGALVSLFVEVVNEGEVAQSRTLSLTLDGAVIDERDVDLDPLARSTVTFTFTAPTAVGSHEVEVDGITRRFEVGAIEAEIVNLLEVVVAPREVAPGDTVTVSVILGNTGQQDGLTDVVLTIDGQVEERREDVLVPAQDQVTLRFQVSRDEARDYTVRVEATEATEVTVLDSSFTVAVAVNIAPVQGTLTIEPASIDIGQSVTITVDVTNEGEAAGTSTVALFVDGDRVQDKDVTLDPGATETVSFTYVEPDAGTHTVRVEGLTGQFEAVGPAPAGGGGGFIIIIIVVIVVVALIGGGIFAYTKMKGGAGA